jgi:signal transduction histidine kinase
VKYGTTASVRLDATASNITVTIDDNGPGIPEADQDRMFLPYERLGRSRNSETGGVGLGLAIARTIARAHGGDVTLSNRAIGGLSVVLRLPR